jgi:hypothetical protein
MELEFLNIYCVLCFSHLLQSTEIHTSFTECRGRVENIPTSHRRRATPTESFSHFVRSLETNSGTILSNMTRPPPSLPFQLTINTREIILLKDSLQTPRINHNLSKLVLHSIPFYRVYENSEQMGI